jgi:hypothetical protein
MMARDCCYIIMMCTLCKEYMSLLLETVHKEFLSVLSFFNWELKLLAAETTCQGFCLYSSVQDSLNCWILRSFMHQVLTVVK